MLFIIQLSKSKNEFSDVYVSYNKVTKKINCIGVQISDVKNDSMILPKHLSTVLKIEEKIFFQFNHSTCGVTE